VQGFGGIGPSAEPLSFALTTALEPFGSFLYPPFHIADPLQEK
jgi:hypothetical protein